MFIEGREGIYEKLYVVRKWIKWLGVKKWDEGKDYMEDNLEISINDNIVNINRFFFVFCFDIFDCFFFLCWGIGFFDDNC